MTRNRRGRRRYSLAIARISVAVTALALGLTTAGLIGGASASGFESQRTLAVSMGVSNGWGANPDGDVLHLADSGWDEYVAGYLHQMNVSWVHMNVSWCLLEPRAGVYSQSTYQAVKNRIDNAVASGQHVLVTVILDAPVFARSAAMQRDRNGNPIRRSYAGCGRPAVYPGGEAAPGLTTAALRSYADTVGRLADCLRGTYCTGPDNRSQVMMESGAEANWHNGWQNGICGTHSSDGGVPWYASSGDDCGQHGAHQMGSGDIGRIQPVDARFFGEMANWAGRRLNGSLAFGHDTILGAPLFRRNGVGWGTGSVAGDAYLAQSVRGGTAADSWAGPSTQRFWDVAGLHVTVCDDGVSVTWNQCAGSMKQHLDEMRSTLRAARINVPIWITGALPCSEGDRKRANGHTAYVCTAREQARDVRAVLHGLRFHACSDLFRPVMHINWFRIVDPDNGKQFSGIGFMRNRSGAPYVPPYIKKAPYRAMAADSNLSCARR